MSKRDVDKKTDSNPAVSTLSEIDKKLIAAATEVISQRLEQAAISALAQRTIGGPEWGSSGARYIYVSASDEADARRADAHSARGAGLSGFARGPQRLA